MLAQFYAPIIGGEERLVQDLSIELVRRGHEVAVATLWQQGLPTFELDHGVRVYRIHSTVQRIKWLHADMKRRHAPPIPDPELVWGLSRVVAQEKPEIVHGHNWMVRSFLPLKVWSRAKLVMTLHDYSLVCATKRMMYRGAPCSGPGYGKCLSCTKDHYGSVKGPLTTFFNWAMSAVERRSVDRFLPISPAVAVGNSLRGERPPFQVIANFVPDDLGTTWDSTDARLMQLPDHPYLLFAGDMSNDKGADVLLSAYGDLSKTLPEGLDCVPPLVIIAKGRQPKALDKEHNVTVFYNWPHSAVMEAWRRCSIALVPSVWAEPFGLVAIEAMAAGRPVIASRTGGLADIVVDGETGLLVTPGDPVALRQAIEKLLADPVLRERMGQAGKRRVEVYRASHIIPSVEQAYRDLLVTDRVVKRLVS
jgi:glycosyltransferase involved in cell wall biosynthesis